MSINVPDDWRRVADDFTYSPPEYTPERRVNGEAVMIAARSHVSADMAQLIKLYDGRSGTGDTRAPGLERPAADISPEELVVLVGSLLRKANQVQTDVAKLGIELAQAQSNAAHTEATRKIAEIASNLHDAQKKEEATKILDIIGKVFAVIGAVAMIALTAGVATPAAAVLLVYVAVDTALTVADLISTNCDGPGLTIGALLERGVTAIAKAAGKSDAEAAEIGQWVSFGLQMALMIGSLVGGFAAGAAKAAKITSEVMVRMRAIVHVVQASAEVAGGVTAITQAGVGASRAVDSLHVAEAQAEQLKAQGEANYYQQILQAVLGELQALLDQLVNGQQKCDAAMSQCVQTTASISAGFAMA